MTKDWSGNGKSTFIIIGASNHTDKERYKCKDCAMFADEDADSAP